MSNFAKVVWSSEEDRYELHIGGVLKAYSNGENDLEHEVGRAEMAELARGKGYMVIVETK